jgi:hypothetical protein
MKALPYISVVLVLSGCAADQASVNRWNDMWIDIALRHKYEKYSCAARALDGYAKDPPCRVHVRKSDPQDPSPAMKPANSDAQTQAQIRELNVRIDRLEEVSRVNVGTNNQNQELIVQQIRDLKAKVEQLQTLQK